MYSIFSLEEFLQDKTITHWPLIIGVEQDVYFSPLTEHFTEKQVKQLQDSNIHFAGEVMMWTRGYYAGLVQTNVDLVAAVDAVKKKFLISETITEMYKEKSKLFRRQYLVDHFKDIDLIKNVAKYFEISFVPTKTTLIGDREYRQLQSFRPEKTKKAIAILYRKYHLSHFLEQKVFEL